MNVVDTGSAIRLLRLLCHLAIVVADIVIVVARETTIDFRYCRSWSINSGGLGGHCWVVLLGIVGDEVSSLLTVEASPAVVVGDLTGAILLSLAISLILISCL
jgi:hypothetical protein